MPIREDVWSHDTCLVCQTQHSTSEEKEEHENEKMHKDRTVVYDFLSKELSCLVPSSSESILYERYYRANTSVAGLDCICELNFSWANSPFWACTICYVSGKTLESADAHLYSSYHKRTYISEYHPERFASLIKAQQRSTADKHSMIEQDAVLDVLYDSKGLAPPDVYILHEKERSWAFQKLGISEQEVPPEYVGEPVDDVHQIVHCHTCCESFVAYEKEDQMLKAWSAHLATTTHQKCRFILTVLNEAKLEEKDGLPDFCQSSSSKTTAPNAFNCVEGAFYGPSCGFEHLVHFKGSNDSFCRLCFCVVSNIDVSDHFASEYHIERFVRKNSPSKLLNAQYLKIEDRQSILLAEIVELGKVEKHQFCDAHFPQLLKRIGCMDKRAFETVSVDEVWVASFKAAWCEDCKQYINLTEQDSWQQHIFEEDHFGWAAKRALCFADGANFVSKSAGKSLPPLRTGQKGWDDKYSVTLGLIPVQDHCYYGLQYIMRDELNRQTTCLCCYLVCSYEDDDVMCLHVRSYDHITRVIHLVNRKLLGTLWKYTDVEQKKTLVLDYLKHCKLDITMQRLVTYDPVMACTSNCFGTVPRILLQLAIIPPELRQSSLLLIENSSQDEINVPLNIAFRSCNVEIKGLESDLVIFFCQECNQSFSCSFEKVDMSFAEHLLGSSHWTRQLALKQNPFDENKRIFNLSSSFEVNRFTQPNEKKKITWKWNDARKAYEFVYAQLGLGDIYERRNFNNKRDLYCTLCAEQLKASKIELEHHIRSFTHIFYYVHKHRHQAIGDLEAMLLKDEDCATKQKNIRKLFNKALKGLEKEQEEITIFDFSLGRFCESNEIKAVLEEDNPISIVDDHFSNAAPMAIYTNKMQKRSLIEGQKFVLAALNKSTSMDEELNVELAKQKLLATSEYSVHPEVETANEEEGENVVSAPVVVCQRGTSITSNSRKSKSPEQSREGSRSPTYKKFHALPDSHQYDYRHRPAFHSFHARASTARFGGAYAYAQRFATPIGGGSVHPHLLRRSVSPERRPGEIVEPRSREKRRSSRSRSPVQYYRGQRLNRSKSPKKSSSYRKRSRSRSHSRNKSRGYERSRRSHSRSRSRSKTSGYSRRHNRSRSNSRSPRNGRREHRSRSKSSEDINYTAIQNSLMNRLKNAKPAKIQINLPIGKETAVSAASTQGSAYHFRNAPDVSRIKIDLDAPLLTAEEISKKTKSRWDTSNDIKPVIPPPSLRLLPPAPTSIILTNAENAKKKVESFAERLLQERGVDLNAILSKEPSKTATSDHNKNISELLATAASMSTASGMALPTTSLTAAAPLVLPPVNLTQPPPIVAAPFGMPPPSTMFSMFPFGNPAMMTFPQTQFPAPPPYPFMMPGAAGAFPSAVAPVVDQAELVMRAKMDLYSKDLVNLKTVEELIEYLWKQGYDKIPTDDTPLLFNEVVKKRKGILGASTLYQIICYNHPELETYYCGMCNHWTTVSEMFNHMTAQMHRLNYMFRNYRKYHEKAVAETDETIRDLLLQKFAESIWTIEGSGQCGHRMRCILNQAAIARLWPKYVECVDNSWKIVDLEDEARKQERPSSGLSSANGNQARLATSGRPGDTTIVCDEPMAISPNRTPEKRETQEDLIKQYLSGRSQNIFADADKKDSRASDSRRSRERSHERSPSHRRSPTERRRERSRSRSRRSRSRSPYGKSLRRREERRRGEREPERSSRRSRSKSKSPKHGASKKGELKSENWGAKAAAFLDKIGDKRGAMELYVSSLTAEQDVPSPAYEALPAADQDPKYVAVQTSSFFDDRLRNATVSRDLNAAEKAKLISEMASSSRRPVSPQPMDPPSRPGRNIPRTVPDNMAKTRKAMGAMLNLQTIYDSKGFISAATFFSVCLEVGIPVEDVVSNPLLRQLAITYNVDLDNVDVNQIKARGPSTPSPPAYGGPPVSQSTSNTSSREQQENRQLDVLSAILQRAQQQQPQDQHRNNAAIDFKSLGTSPQELVDIMRKINGGNSAAAANQLTGGAGSSSLRSRGGYAQAELSEEVDYLYPGYDDDQMDEERDPCDIESSINRLTFAFSNNKKPVQEQQQQNQMSVARRNLPAQNQPPRNYQQQQRQQQYQHQQYQQQTYEEDMEEDDEGEDEQEDEEEQQDDVSFFNRQGGGPPQPRQMIPPGQRPPPAHHQHGNVDPRFSRGEAPANADPRYWQRQQQFVAGQTQQMGKNQGKTRPAPRNGAAAGEGQAKPTKPNANLEPLGAKRVFGNPNVGSSGVGNDPRQQPAPQQPNSKVYGEYNLGSGADPRQQLRSGYPPQRNVAERPKAPQQPYDFTADEDYMQGQSGSGQQRTSNQGQPRQLPNTYLDVAEQIGDDWNSMESHMHSLLNPHSK